MCVFWNFVLEMNLLVALGSPYMPNGEYRSMWKFVQGIRRSDLNNCHTQVVAFFSRLRSRFKRFFLLACFIILLK